jgi:hypothetical protein
MSYSQAYFLVNLSIQTKVQAIKSPDRVNGQGFLFMRNVRQLS